MPPPDTPSELRNLLAPYVGLTATTTNLNKLRFAVVDFYWTRGFVNADIDMTLDNRGRRIVPAFLITQGERYRLGEISVEGFEKTVPCRITARLAGLKGKYVDGGVYENRIRQIIATGAFSSVQTDFAPAGEGVLDATLRIEEARARGISLSLGLRQLRRRGLRQHDPADRRLARRVSVGNRRGARRPVHAVCEGGLRDLVAQTGRVRRRVGHNLTEDANEPSGTFHFAIGTAF